MSKNWFTEIMKLLRFSSATCVEENNPFKMIEPYSDLLRKRCQTLIQPTRPIAVNEVLIL